MRNQINKVRIAAVLLALAAVVTASVVLTVGCTKRLDGEITANEKPIVYFVNIPPGPRVVCDTVGDTITCDTTVTRFSRNPEIHWVGTDRDGLIAYFRYHVATASDLNGLDPMDYISTVPNSAWIRLDVDPKGPDPMTSNIISMSADLTDPVLTYVDQYVFLQAYDEEGLGSDIIYRLFSRNDNPPTSFVLRLPDADTPFVNSINPGGIITGVKLRWRGEDPIDYPSDPPPFEFDWRLYGPYSSEEMQIIRDSFMTLVYVTNDGDVKRIGDTVFRCDTFPVEGGFEEECDTIIVTDPMPASALVFGDTARYMRVDDPDFDGLEYDRAQQRSDGWVSNQADTLWNVFEGFHSDTTVEMRFVFWLRSRDDALVPALVPYFVEFPVINPRFERDIIILDFSKPLPGGLNDPIARDTVKAYWKTTIDAWAANTGRAIVFDTNTITEGDLGNKGISADFFYMGFLSQGAPIADLLKHKVMILYDDVLGKPLPGQWTTIYKSIDAGINVWVTGRTMIIAGSSAQGLTGAAPPFNYRRYFGVDSIGHTGWASYLPQLGGNPPPGLYQDFIGTFSTKPGEWPDLAINEEYLHTRYEWDLSGMFPFWNEDCPSLPEVDWCVRSFGTEILYKYKSCYGASHPLGGEHNLHGRPVAHRLATSLFKTVHFKFTPLSIDSVAMQVVVDSVLNWLYDPTLGGGNGQISENRYPDAAVKVSLSEARRNYEKRCKEYEKMRQEAIIID